MISQSFQPSSAAQKLMCPELIHLPWGYTLTAEDAQEGMPLLGRALGRFIAVIIGLVLLGVWVVPGVESFGDPILVAMKLGLSCLFIGLGGLLYLFGQDGQRAETQVDLVSREIRAGSRKQNGTFKLTAQVGFDEVSAILIARSESDLHPSIFARIGDGPDAIEIVSGAEEFLVPIRDRIVRDLRTDRSGLQAMARPPAQAIKVVPPAQAMAAV